ncbi:MAG: hypothetical protein K9J49_01680 [Candidatus Methylopumilus sp.]|nr:hypothetical protein [Candidatus Methylopumilus sp.]
MNTSHNKSVSRLGRFLCVATMAVLFNGAAALAREQATQQSTIDELLRLDSQAALLAARKNIFGITQHTQAGLGADVVRPESNQVLAIYGVGKLLTAEVLLDSEPHVFKHSRARPVWGSSLQYRLERILPPCVYLKKSGQAQVICLRKGP